MPAFMVLRSGRGFNPVSFLATVLVLGGVFAMLRDRVPSQREAQPSWEECRGGDTNPLCAAVLETEGGGGAARGASGGQALGGGLVAPNLSASEACLSVGYLCAEINQTGAVDIHRWKDHEGTIVVHIPLPTGESAGDARRLQSAAAAGVRAWNGQPFPISVDERGNRESDFAVQWHRSLNGTQIRVARTQWSAQGGARGAGPRTGHP
jgi:hypothetical protein